MAGGIVLSIGNLSSQYVWAFLGLSVAGVITSSIIVVIGISFSSYTLLIYTFIDNFFSFLRSTGPINLIRKSVLVSSDSNLLPIAATGASNVVLPTKSSVNHH